MNLHGLQGFFPGVASAESTSKIVVESDTDTVIAGDTLIGDNYVREIEMRIGMNDPNIYDLDGVVMDEETLQSVEDHFDVMGHPNEISATQSFNRSGDAVEEDLLSRSSSQSHAHSRKKKIALILHW